MIPNAAPPAPAARAIFRRWGVALAGFAAVMVGALIAGRFQHGREWGQVASYLALAALSMLSGFWGWLILINILTAGPWLAATIDRSGQSRAVTAFELINRQIGHFELLFAVVAVTAMLTPRLWVQWLVISFAYLFGARIVELLARVFRITRLHTDVFWTRRVVFYVVIVLVGGTFSILYPHSGIPRLFLAVFIGIALRFGVWLINLFRLRRGIIPSIGWPRNESVRRLFDATVVFAAFLSFALVLNGRLRGVLKLDVVDMAQARSYGCPFDESRPAPELSFFIVADSQFHELGGARTGGNLDLIDYAVPVAVRPVELDLLSGVTLSHFAHQYDRFLLSQPNLPWIHLGDIGDLGCKQELDRFGNDYLDRFRGPLLTLVPGNHDSTFMGNFAWHPSWEEACDNAPLDKRASDDLIDKMAQKRPPPVELSRILLTGNRNDRFNDSLRGNPQADDRHSALPAIGYLGTLGGKPTLGVFLDTSDYPDLNVGIAGAAGAISIRQSTFILKEIDRFKKKYPEPYLIVFMHHPLDELDQRGKALIREQLPRSAPVLLIVSAHTHLSARRNQCVDGNMVPELVVGSTIDPPQEVALLEVGSVGSGLSARLRTIPAIERRGLGCAPSLPAGEYQAIASAWNNLDQLSSAIAASSSPVTAERCQEVVKAIDNDRKVYCAPMLSTQLDPDELTDPAKAKAGQERRAIALLNCACGGGRCPSLDDKSHPFADSRTFKREALGRLDELGALDARKVSDTAREWQSRWSRAPAPEDLKRALDSLNRELIEPELVCMSWAASALQGEKRQELDDGSIWSYPRALQDVFYLADDAIVPGAKELVVPIFPQHKCRVQRLEELRNMLE